MHRQALPAVLAGLFFVSTTAAAHAATSDTQTHLSPIVVTAGPSTAASPLQAFLHLVPLPPKLKATAADTSDLLAHAPGAAVMRNGAQTGIMQLDGLGGNRVRTLIDGMQITPAGPNSMDPPLSYIDPASVHSVALFPGITPASVGGDVIGGTALVSTPPPRFADDGQFLATGTVGGRYNSAWQGRSLYGNASLASDNTSGSLSVERSLGGNQSFPGGTVSDTGFQLTNYRAGFARRLGDGTLNASVWRHVVNNAGTPDLMMDIISVDSDIYSLGYDTPTPFGSLRVQAYRHWTDHLMDNFTLRPAGMMRMETFASNSEKGGTFSTRIDKGTDTWRAGIEYHDLTENADQANVGNGMRQNLFVDAERKRFGAFVSWAHDFPGAWRTRIGLRNDTVRTDAGDIQQRFTTTPAQDQQAFNQADKSLSDSDWGLTALASYAPSEHMSWHFGLARQVQAPSLLERYLWTASGANAGLADGRSYIGNLALNPQTANKVVAGIDWDGGDWRVNPSLFYNRVSDYIQGMAGLYAANPAVLKFVNIGSATLYGIDTRWSWQRHGGLWGFDGTLSYVYGKDDDNGDYLYRLPPLRAYTEAYYHAGLWKLALGVETAARQSKVAAYNKEQPTPGYTVFDLGATWRPTGAMTLALGVNNLFNRYYTPALNGINRVTGGDVAAGAKLPGPGRSAYASLSYQF
jgi:iron complex outermembrane receptor protein